MSREPPRRWGWGGGVSWAPVARQSHLIHKRPDHGSGLSFFDNHALSADLAQGLPVGWSRIYRGRQRRPLSKYPHAMPRTNPPAWQALAMRMPGSQHTKNQMSIIVTTWPGMNRPHAVS